jgi:hypothetical protein
MAHQSYVAPFNSCGFHRILALQFVTAAVRHTAPARIEPSGEPGQRRPETPGGLVQGLTPDDMAAAHCPSCSLLSP